MFHRRISLVMLSLVALSLSASAGELEGETVAEAEPFTLSISFGDETLDQSAGPKQAALLRKAALRTKRIPPGEETGFEGVAVLNGTGFRFDRPTDVANLTRTVMQVESALKRMKLSMSDLGSFDELPPKPLAAANAPNDPKKLSPAQVQYLIKQRSQQIYMQKMRSNGGRIPNPQQMMQWQQQAYQQAVNEAKKAGVVPEAPPAPMGTPEEIKQQQIDSMREALIPILQNGVPLSAEEMEALANPDGADPEMEAPSEEKPDGTEEKTEGEPKPPQEGEAAAEKEAAAAVE